jgi:hypothetical protein
MSRTFERLSGMVMLFMIASIAVFYPKAGTLVASLSAVVGFFVIYLIPCVAHLKDVFTDGRY